MKRIGNRLISQNTNKTDGLRCPNVGTSPEVYTPRFGRVSSGGATDADSIKCEVGGERGDHFGTYTTDRELTMLLPTAEARLSSSFREAYRRSPETASSHRSFRSLPAFTKRNDAE